MSMLEWVDLLVAVRTHVPINRGLDLLTDNRLAIGTMSDDSKPVGCGQLQLHSRLHDDAYYLER